MGLMSSTVAYDMIHRGIIELYPVSIHDLYRETAILSKALGDRKEKETRRSPDEIKVEHVSLDLRTELVLHLNNRFVQGLPFLIFIATPLRLYTCIFLADGRRESSVKLAIGALLKALRKRNFVPISLL